MRTIDADALIPLIQEDKIEGESLDIIKALGDGLQAETLNQACDRHIKIINSLPTIEATPVKHGKWEDVNGDGSLWRCSVCGETQCCDSNYCGECGAKMEGATDDAK